MGKTIPITSAVFLSVFLTHLAIADSSATQPTSAPSAPTFDASPYLTGDWFGERARLDQMGIDIQPYLIVDYTKVLQGGLDTRNYSIRERFNFPVSVDADKLFGLHGGSFLAVLQIQRGGNASHRLVGDVQNFSFGTDADGRTQLGKLWYEQKLFNDFRVRAGKLDGNDDFDVIDDAQDFMNNSFQTSATLGLLPSFPDTGMGVEAYYEPASGFYVGGGAYDGSGARGVRTGEFGPGHFFDRPDDLFYIMEVGQRYQLPFRGQNLPGKIVAGGWYDTNHFARLNGVGRDTGTGGAYFNLDQTLYKPNDGPQSLAAFCSLGWDQPTVNTINWNELTGMLWTGPFE